MIGMNHAERDSFVSPIAIVLSFFFEMKKDFTMNDANCLVMAIVSGEESVVANGYKTFLMSQAILRYDSPFCKSILLLFFLIKPHRNLTR